MSTIALSDTYNSNVYLKIEYMLKKLSKLHTYRLYTKVNTYPEKLYASILCFNKHEH